jgi:hypothetical protein
LALKEIKPEDGFTFQNLIIILAVLVVGALLMALSFSQGKTLDAIGEQEKQLRDEIHECGGGDTKIGRLLTSMSDHHSLVRNLMMVVRVIIILFMLVVVGTLFWSYVAHLNVQDAAPAFETIPASGSTLEN